MLYIVLFLFAVIASEAKAPPLVSVKASGPLSVSGISAGGYAAVQFHVAFSSTVTGAGIIAGGPFWCAEDNVEIALHACMTNPEYIDVNYLVGITKTTALTGTIDAPSHMRSSRVWLFSGTQDTVVVPGVVFRLLSYYNTFVDSTNIATEFNLSAQHSFVTADYGSGCNYLGMPSARCVSHVLGSPYINNCGFDSAGALLQHIYGPLKSPVAAVDQNV